MRLNLKSSNPKKGEYLFQKHKSDGGSLLQWLLTASDAEIEAKVKTDKKDLLPGILKTLRMLALKGDIT